jgi:hypothetical protein
VGASRLADFNEEVEAAVAKKTELLERRIKALTDATSKLRDSSSLQSSSSQLSRDLSSSDDDKRAAIFSERFVMVLIAIVCTWLGAVIAINNS